MINLFKGHPTDRLLPTEFVNEAVTSLLTRHRPEDQDDEDRHPLAYGTDPGSLSVRRTIAEWSARLLQEDDKIDPDCINLTNGASYGAALALCLCTHSQSGYTKRAFLVSPTYFLINTVFLDAGFGGKLTAVEENEQGIDLQFLEAELTRLDQEPEVDIDQVLKSVGDRPYPRKFYRYVIYLVPSFSNPRGGILSLEQRKQLLNLARKHDVLILCDDVYDMLDYREGVEPLPKRLVALDRATLQFPEQPGNVISNCTFSKLVGPGVRVGWQECPSPLLAKQLCSGGAIRSGGTPAQLNTMVIREMILGGMMDRVIENLKATYGDRARQAHKAMETYLPKGTLIEGGDGGYFFWVTLPETYNVPDIVRKCRERDVLLAGGEAFEVSGDEKNWGARCFRVSFGFEEASRLVEAITIWGDVCRESASS